MRAKKEMRVGLSQKRMPQQLITVIGVFTVEEKIGKLFMAISSKCRYVFTVFSENDFVNTSRRGVSLTNCHVLKFVSHHRRSEVAGGGSTVVVGWSVRDRGSRERLNQPTTHPPKRREERAEEEKKFCASDALSQKSLS